jgi:hypothetical protein
MQISKASAWETQDVLRIPNHPTVLDKNCAGDSHNKRFREERLAKSLGPALLRQAVVIDEENQFSVGFPNACVTGITETASRSRESHISDPGNFTRRVGFFDHDDLRHTSGVAGRPD